MYRKYYSGNNSSFSTNFLYFGLLTTDDLANICSSPSESPSVLDSESSSFVALNDLYSEIVHPSGSDVLITINSIF
ncbi:hypothetical protein OtV6_097c [Ostreococcus tauri virus RT-2011]|nr:hypothetical protein OtV6_097c [Ostreococcus tauri virus RT-2011]